jgi:hypothetical protein
MAPKASPSRDARRDLVLALAITWPSIGLLVAIGWGFKWWKIGGFLDHFQTLVTGLIAIVAAVVAAYFVQKQINLARDQEEERIDRVFDAGRAMLPLTLKGVFRYSDECADFLLAARAAEAGEPAPTVPALDAATITQLRDMVAASPATVRRQLAVVLGELQVQASRIEQLVHRGRWNAGAGPFTVDQYLTANATLGALCDCFLPFARWESELVNLAVAAADIRSALRRQTVYVELYPRAHEYADAFSRDLARRVPN